MREKDNYNKLKLIATSMPFIIFDSISLAHKKKTTEAYQLAQKHVSKSDNLWVKHPRLSSFSPKQLFN